jgi:hypothetical protein
MLDGCNSQSNIQTAMSISPFLGIKPLSKSEQQKRKTELENVNDFESEITHTFTKMGKVEETPIVQILNNLIQTNDKKIKNMSTLKTEVDYVLKAIQHYNPTSEVKSIMKEVLDRIGKMLKNVQKEWIGTNDLDRLTKFDYSKEFYRLWAVLQFVRRI